MKRFFLKIVSIYLNLTSFFFPKLGGRQTFLIFCFPFKAKITPEQQEFLNTSHAFKLPVEDFEIQCYKWGTGTRNILFVHGWQSNTFRWKRYIESIPQTEFTIYSFDAPGHGNSGSRIGNIILFEKSILKIIRHMGQVESIISHSIGSFSSLYFIDQNPQYQPKKVVSLATPNSIDDFLDFYFSILQLNKKTKRSFINYFIEYTQRDLSFFRLSNLLSHNKAKGLIIHDNGDKSVSVEYSKHLHTIWPQSKLIITEGLGHKLRDKNILKTVKEFVVNDN